MRETRRITTLGFIGLGSMGRPIARRLLEGNQVYGNNRTKDKAIALIERGLIWRDTPREVAAAADITFSMVTDDAALNAITSGPDGILSGLRPGRIYVDMSTVSPHASRELARRVRVVGATMLDAPVSGSIPAAGSGALAIMVGGPERAFRMAEPLLRRLASTVTHVGENGQGLLLKLATNISLAAQMLDPKLAAETISASAIGSPMLRARVPLVLDLPRQPWFDMRLMHKDIRLALEAARKPGIPMPAASAADGMLTRAEELGYGHRDIAGFLQVLERTSAEALPEPV